MKKTLFSFLVIAMITIFGCKEEILLPEMANGEDGISTVFAFDVLAPTDAHLNGGWLFNIGYDVNRDSTLNDDEVTASAPLWHGNDGINGTDGKDGLNGADGINGKDGTDGVDGKDGKDGVDGQTPNLYIVTVDLPATEGHENGGILVTTVWDKNGNGLIEQEDIVGAYTVWHGNNGSDGIDGQDGQDGKSPYIGEDNHWYYWDVELNIWVDGGESQGADGQDGSNGIDGKSPYIENGYWFFWNGTVWINGGKSQGEQGATGAQGEQGERGTIVGYTVETALNCSTNGYRITMTIDEGLPTEYEQWFEVCDGRVGDTGAIGAQGPKGDDGYTSLINISQKNEDGCVIIASGLDLNRDGELQRSEVTDIATICDGQDGLTSLINVSNKDEGGCVTIASGLDLNGDGELQREEATDIAVICDGDDGIPGINGKDGSNGDDGLTTLVTVSDKVEGCVTIASGVDDNDNGVLDQDEIDFTETVCDGVNGHDGDDGDNGDDGLTSLVTLTQDGDCVIIKSGLDIDGDEELDDNEVTQEATVCGCDLECDDDCDDDEDTKVEVCHKELKWYGWKYSTMELPITAVPAHLAHGDTLGSCDND